MQKIIAIMFQSLKTIKQWKLTENLKLLCSPTIKWWPFQFLPVIAKNSFCLADTFFQLDKYQLFVFSQCASYTQKTTEQWKI